MTKRSSLAPNRPGPSKVARAWEILAVPVVVTLLSLLVGAVVILGSELIVTGRKFDPFLWFTAYAALVQGAFGGTDAIVSTLVYTTPLVFGGLAVGFGFKAGLFNIGAQGQFLVGALGAVIVGVALADAPAPIAIVAATMAGIIAGGLWGFIPGFLKAVSGAHEVVSTIMLNYVAVQLLAALVSGPLKVPKSPSPVTYDVGNAAYPIVIGGTGHIGIILAIVAAGFV